MVIRNKNKKRSRARDKRHAILTKQIRKSEILMELEIQMIF